MDAVVRWKEVDEMGFTVWREGATVVRGCGSLVDAEKGLRARFDLGENCYLAIRGVYRISSVLDLTEPTDEDIFSDPKWDNMPVDE